MEKNEYLNTAVFTTKFVLDKNPILFVYHHLEDGAWEFIGKEENNEEDYRIISLEEITLIDSSVINVLDMPLGFYAKRNSKSEKWIINKID